MNKNTTYVTSSTQKPHFFFSCLLLFIVTAGVMSNAQAQTMAVLPAATVGRPYDFKLVAAGKNPYSWWLLNGALAPGLGLTNDGRLTGTPSAAGKFEFKLRVIDSSAPALLEEKWIQLEVKGIPLLVNAVTEAPIPPGADADAAVPIAVAVAAKPPFILPTSTADEETINLTENLPTPMVTPTFDADTATTNVTSLKQMIGSSIGTSTSNFEDGDYCVVHLIRWKPLSAENKSEPDREIWALFKSKKLNSTDVEWNEQKDPKNEEIFSTRIFGHKRVAVLLIHLDTPSAWDVRYKITITQKTPLPLQHALDLATAVFGGAGPGQKDKSKNIWGARMMLVKYGVSDIAVKVNAVTGNAGRPIEQSKEYANKYDNEGKYHWDVSIGLPVKSVRELKFKSEGNQVVAESKEKQSVYGFLNLYPSAVDLKSDDFFTKPHFVLGVPLASKPLQRPFVGLGTGLFKKPLKFNIFAGVVFIRERVPQTLAEGDTATTGQLEGDLRTRWVRKFMFGINLPVSQIKDAIKK
jgi:hypothetical protein